LRDGDGEGVSQCRTADGAVRGHGSVVEHELAMLKTRVRFSLAAPVISAAQLISAAINETKLVYAWPDKGTVKFTTPADIRLTGRLQIVDNRYVHCDQSDSFKIDLHDPASLDKIIVLVRKCLISQSINRWSGCQYCPFKKNNKKTIATINWPIY
jgi:hypothetical protein